MSPKQRYLLLIIAVGFVVLAGVWTALLLERRAPQVREEAGQTTIIREITLAGLRRGEEPNTPNPLLAHKREYTTEEPLAMRVTTAADVRRPVQINVRLVSDKGDIVQLRPSSVTFEPGESTFCCWTVDEPGSYSMQIFRPEGTVTSLPLTIRKAF